MGMSGINSMQAMISAGAAMTMVQRQGSVATSMKGREGILEAEIKLDSARGGNVERKQEELEETQKRLTQVQSMQMDILSEANKKMEEARKEDQKAEAAEKKAAEKKAAEKRAEKKKAAETKKTDGTNEEEKVQGEGLELQNVDGVTEVSNIVISETVNVSSQTTVAYPHVDVRL